MIQIIFARHWFTVAAVTVNDILDVHIAFGLTQRGAQKNLMKTMDKYYKELNE